MALVSNGLYTTLTNGVEIVFYNPQFPNLPGTFEALPESAAAAPGFVKSEFSSLAIVDLNEKRTL